MSGIGETISTSLARFFERKLVEQIPCQDYLRAEPEGYNSTWDYECKRCVLRHPGTGIRVGADPLDLVERVDRRNNPEPTRFVYLYLTAEKMPVFSDVQKVANHTPREAWKILEENDILQRIDGSEDSDGLAWYSAADGFTTVEPVTVARQTEHRVMARSNVPWHGADFCLAFHVPARNCRPAAGGCIEVWELLEPIRLEEDPERHVQVDYGIQLIEAASRRDVDGVRSCLEARANVNFKDTRGWTALHAASAVRPRWGIFDLLMEHPKCNLIVRSHTGQLPVDVADKSGQVEIASVLREKMRQHPKGKHLVT
jgi:hypothetical protein